MNSRVMHKDEGVQVLILGAYGLLGAGIASHLSTMGFNIKGLGRNQQTAERALPEVDWIIGDLRAYTRSEDWQEALEEVDFVVNCSGALQDGPNDELENIHHLMVAALAAACQERDICLIQISAVGAVSDASTQFLSSKARGDQAIRKSGCQYTIFRPGLILASHAYGGSAMLRMLAAVPFVQVVSHPDAKIQTISLTELSRAVEFAILGKVPEKFECDLIEPKVQNLRDVVTKIRKWLGFKPTKLNLAIPSVLALTFSKCADTLSWLGWKSPLRSSGLQVLREGVEGDPTEWDSLDLFQISSIDQTLGNMRATSEDRLSARISLLFPLLISTLSLFWILSGLFGLMSLDKATDVLERVGWSQQLATISVVFWSLVDLALGAAILIRKYARQACIGMVMTCLFYLMASSVFVPHLWLDPLGPLVKVLPAILLALVTRAALDNR